MPTITITPRFLSRARRLTLGLAFAGFAASGAAAQDAIPTEVPAGTKIVFADQSEKNKTLFAISGEGAKLAAEVEFLDFESGPTILEAFRAGALDLATVGNGPPIQAHAAGEHIPIVLARRTPVPTYTLFVTPGVTISTLEELKGKKIAYVEGSARQPFVLAALKAAGLTTKDVTLIKIPTNYFPDAVRSGQVDVAPLSEPTTSHYRTDPATQGSSEIPKSEHDRLPKGLGYLYASGEALKDPAKSAAIRDFIVHYIAATNWAAKNKEAWIKAYYVDNQRLSPEDAEKVAVTEGGVTFPLLSEVVSEQQDLIDLIHDAGDLPTRLDAREEFDLRFDDVIKAATSSTN